MDVDLGSALSLPRGLALTLRQAPSFLQASVPSSVRSGVRLDELLWTPAKSNTLIVSPAPVPLPLPSLGLECDLQMLPVAGQGLFKVTGPFSATRKNCDKNQPVFLKFH